MYQFEIEDWFSPEFAVRKSLVGRQALGEE